MRHKTLCIIGTGYVGTANAVGFARLGHSVVGYDVLIERVRGLANGIAPYRESGLTEALRGQLASGRLHFVESLGEAVASARFIVLAVGTPTRADGSSDLSALDRVVDELLALDLREKIVVLRSTVPPGTSALLQRRFGETPLIFSPEFLREGFALADFMRPSRTVIGARDRSASREYAALFDGPAHPIHFTALTDAETIKAFSNAFLATKISFANEVANFCDAVGADAPTVLAGIGADARIGPGCLSPGIGFGGPCLSKDVRALRHRAEAAGVATEILAATLRVNDRQPARVGKMLRQELGGSLDGKRIAVWGLAFKAGTDDIRHSLAIEIVNGLLGEGAAVRAYDPAVADTAGLASCELAASAVDALAGADALLVLTDWPEFASVDPALIATQLRHDVVVDGRNLLDHEALADAGLRYRGIGRTAEPARDVPQPGPVREMISRVLSTRPLRYSRLSPSKTVS
jgi:UDPglucose 6-dehydrogenase